MIKINPKILTSKDQVVKELLSLYNLKNKITEPLINEYCSFSRRAIRTHFGSVTNFLKEYNLINKDNFTFTLEELDLLIENIKNNNPKITNKILYDNGITYFKYKKFFKNLNNLISHYNLTFEYYKKKPLNLSKEQLSNRIIELFNEYDDINREIITVNDNISESIIKLHFGSLNNAILELNLKKSPNIKNYSKEEVIREINNIINNFGYFSKTLLEKHGKINHKVINRIFGNFKNMHNELDTIQRESSISTYSEIELIDELNKLYSKFNCLSVNIIKEYSIYSLTPFLTRFKSIRNMYIAINKPFIIKWISSHLAIKSISEYLNEEPILDFRHKSIRNPKTNRTLPFDAYFQKHNLLIEYNGKQHYEFVSKFHNSNNDLSELQERDAVKYELAKKNNFNLLIIKYDQEIDSTLNCLQQICNKDRSLDLSL